MSLNMVFRIFSQKLIGSLKFNKVALMKGFVHSTICFASDSYSVILYVNKIFVFICTLFRVNVLIPNNSVMVAFIDYCFLS